MKKLTLKISVNGNRALCLAGSAIDRRIKTMTTKKKLILSDICLPDYANKSYPFAIPVHNDMTCGAVAKRLEREDPSCDPHQENDYYDARDNLIRDLRNQSKTLFIAKNSLESDDSDQCDLVYAYFDIVESED